MIDYTERDIEDFTNNIVFKGFIRIIEESIVQEWKASVNADDRERLHQRMRVIQEFQAFCRTRLTPKPDNPKQDY